jgi:hypothetical protein
MPVPQLGARVSTASRRETPRRITRVVQAQSNSPARHPEMRISIAGLAESSAANEHPSEPRQEQSRETRYTIYSLVSRPNILRLLTTSVSVVRRAGVRRGCECASPTGGMSACIPAEARRRGTSIARTRAQNPESGASAGRRVPPER